MADQKSGKWSEMRERILADPVSRERYEPKRDALIQVRRKLLASLAPDDPAFSDDTASNDEDPSSSDPA